MRCERENRTEMIRMTSFEKVMSETENLFLLIRLNLKHSLQFSLSRKKMQFRKHFIKRRPKREENETKQTLKDECFSCLNYLFL